MPRVRATGTVSALSLLFAVLIPQAPTQMFPASSVSAEGYSRAQNADVLYSFIREWALQHGKMEIMEKCQTAGCPITAVFTIAEAAEQPHLKARDYFVDMEHPELGRLKNLGAPFKLPASPGGPTTAAPRSEEHTSELQSPLN